MLITCPRHGTHGHAAPTRVTPACNHYFITGVHCPVGHALVTSSSVDVDSESSRSIRGNAKPTRSRGRPAHRQGRASGAARALEPGGSGRARAGGDGVYVRHPPARRAAAERAPGQPGRPGDGRARAQQGYLSGGVGGRRFVATAWTVLGAVRRRQNALGRRVATDSKSSTSQSSSMA